MDALMVGTNLFLAEVLLRMRCADGVHIDPSGRPRPGPRSRAAPIVTQECRNGVVYGSKVRFPHALVYVGSIWYSGLWFQEGLTETLTCRMILLFRSGR